MSINLDFLNLNTEVKLGNVDVSELEKNKVYTLVGHDGLYRAKHNGVIKTVSKICDVSKSVLDKNYHIEEGFELLVPKIPFKYYLMCLNYFRDIHTQDRTEAGLIFYRMNEDTDINVLQPYIDEGSLILDDGLIVYCPLQINSGGLHEIRGETMYEYLRENSDPYVEVHSHHTIGCSWSGVDNDNMCHHQLFTVFRHIYRFEDTLTRYRFDNKFFDIKTHEIFELPFITDEGVDVSKVLGIYELKTKHAEFYPEEWLKRSTVKGEYSRSFLTYLNDNGFNFYAKDRIAEIDRFEKEVGFENYDNKSEFETESKDSVDTTNYLGNNYDDSVFESNSYLNSEQLFDTSDNYYDNFGFEDELDSLKENEDEEEDTFEKVNEFVLRELNKESNKVDTNETRDDVSEYSEDLDEENNHTEDSKVEDDGEDTLVKDALSLKGVDWSTLRESLDDDGRGQTDFEDESKETTEDTNSIENNEDSKGLIKDSSVESKGIQSIDKVKKPDENKVSEGKKEELEENPKKEDVGVLGAILSSLFKSK